MENVVTWGCARFTLLSVSLLRLQLHGPGSSWDTRPSLSMPFSEPPSAPVPYNVSYSEDTVVVTSSAFRLSFNKTGCDASGFTASNTEVTLLVPPHGSWHPGADGSVDNLGGTRLDLGCYDTFAACYSNGLGWGPLSRGGWALWDDTNSTKIAASADPALGFAWFNTSAPASVDAADWFLFCAGKDYRAGVADFGAVSGQPPLPPYAAFGVWWSTWYAFSEGEFDAVVLAEYAARGLPLDVAVLDMDWHIEPNEPNCSSWGGFTWNRALFPGAEAWVTGLRSGGGGGANPSGEPLAVSLNGHPDDGIGPCEENYTAFAVAIGADPTERAKFPCEMANATWVRALIETMLVPKGISFWWTDYSGCDPPRPAVLPLASSSGCPTAAQSNASTQELLWSNYVYTASLAAAGSRPLVLSRYGGVGSQRFGIGFSGDTQSTWDTLALQVAMTPTAANVLFGYWSHDLGGYNIYCPQGGEIAPCPCETVVQPCNLTLNTCARADAELYTRWLQFGALAPVFRTHCSHCDRRIWSYPEPYYGAMAAALRFRRTLQPYVYTAAAAATQSSVVPLHPLYYDWPAGFDEAYDFAASEYLLGDALLAAPVAAPASVGPPSPVWLPPGVWLPWDCSGPAVAGPVTLPAAPVALTQYRLWARGGAVVASQPSTAGPRGTTVVWVVFGGADAGGGVLYEDDGTTTSAAAGRTALNHSTSTAASAASTTALHVSAMEGTFAGAPASRRHVLQLRALAPAGPTSVSCGGAILPATLPPPPELAEAYNATGWWVVPAQLEQLWLAAGAVVVVTPLLPVSTPLDCEVVWTTVDTT